MKRKKNLLLFDFDGTITKRDTLLDFLIFYAGTFKFVWGLLKCFPYILLFKMKIISNQNAKEYLFNYFFFNISEDYLIKVGNQYSKKRLLEILNPVAVEKINFHRQKNDELVVVSASPSYWYSGWCRENGVSKIISTDLEILNGSFTGKIKGRNCYGPEKVNRIKQELNLNDYDYVYAFGDSKGDRELLEMADESYLKFKRIK